MGGVLGVDISVEAGILVFAGVWVAAGDNVGIGAAVGVGVKFCGIMDEGVERRAAGVVFPQPDNTNAVNNKANRIRFIVYHSPGIKILAPF